MNYISIKWLIILIILFSWLIPWEDWSYSEESRFHSKDYHPDLEHSITIGAESGTMSALLMKVTAILLKEHGYSVKEIYFAEAKLLRAALEAGVIHLYWESAYQEEWVEEDREKGFEWLLESKITNKPVLLMKQKQANEWNVHTISELAEWVRTNKVKVRYAADKDLIMNKDLNRNLNNGYELRIPDNDLVSVDPHMLYQALNENHVDVAIGWSADSRIREYQLIELADDQLLFPSYPVSPVAQQEILEHVRPLLSEIMQELTLEKVLELQYEVDINNQEISKSAREFLRESNLLLRGE